MVLVHPLGVEELELDRRPWVTLGIVACCAVLFFITWVVPESPMGGSDTLLEQMFDTWQEHPNLAPPAVLVERLRPDVRARMESLHTEAVQKLGEPSAALQSQMDAWATEYVQATEASLLRRLSLVPERGALQWGWLFHMFLHFGWMHLLGNMFFLYLVGPMLEDVWDRPVFGAFFLVSGLVAALAQVFLAGEPTTMMAGASGAVAGAMGAFSFRFATKRIRMGYFVWMMIRAFRGTFNMPAWMAGAVWVGLEVYSLVTGNTSGVAVMAHVGGFAFGLATAVTLRFSGLEDRYLTPAVTRKTGNYVRHRGLDAAEQALREGQLARARKALTDVLAAYPDSAEASLLMFQVERREGLPDAGARLDRTLLKLLTMDQQEAVLVAVEQLGADFEPTALRPLTASRLATLFDARGLGGQHLDALLGVAAQTGGATGARAMLRRAELAMESRRRDLARAHLDTLAGMTGVPGDVSQRADELNLRLRPIALVDEPEPSPLPAARPAGPRALSLDGVLEPHAPPPRPAPRLMGGSIVGASETGLRMHLTSGEQRELPYARIIGVSPALVPVPVAGQTVPRLQPVTDLVLHWGDATQGPVAVRLGLAQLRLTTHYPDLPPKEGYARWLQDVVRRSGATLVSSSPEAILRGEYPRYADLQAMTEALVTVRH
ncbi:rhomboid family intramembrane serine protease [Myxococcaceae bacterium JPH2]|nr:rhomboid family intramembrane serine protease [Myxococcaceae bacterium JPH2]